ncbi:Nickel-responsive regulator [Candidatus Methanoperedenaceae archaeon GB50]|uniref:Putative nickel-responsive regulator n=1 Tax=Desulfofervidus auxilii TaxID=1621989 RepID=A0A7V1N2U4_DESA2|nr:MAG: nickel-responsive transcriptional regulator NikR [Candidatus Omnitrophota bacterium]CAD7769618.1 Nickel-responsive regulator [Candidatus Methanoperedenaceae archaeon GB50]HEB74348.1 nickel-responsive transcriptional regulator NikR [Candidatus Desulfofervidus auxilii]
MSNLVRFGICMNKDLLKNFDAFLRKKGFKNRSQAIAQCLRDCLSQQWEETSSKETTGTIILVYNHEKRELVDNLIDLQHEFVGSVVSTLHVHLDSHNCLEVIVVRGKAKDLKILADKLISVKGVKQGYFRVVAP